ncbi:hypothetical protein Tco_0695619 [Tanacetum coccineum]
MSSINERLLCQQPRYSRQHVDNVEQNDASDSDLDDDDYNIYEYDSESEESDTASVDHLSDREEEIYDTRTRQPDPKPKKMFDGSKSRMYPHGIRPIGFGVSWDPIDGQTMLGVLHHKIESQEQEAPMQEQPVQEQPLQEQPVQRRPVQQPVQKK